MMGMAREDGLMVTGQQWWTKSEWMYAVGKPMVMMLTMAVDGLLSSMGCCRQWVVVIK